MLILAEIAWHTPLPKGGGDVKTFRKRSAGEGEKILILEAGCNMGVYFYEEGGRQGIFGKKMN